MNHNLKMMSCLLLLSLTISGCVTGGVDYNPCLDPKIKGQWKAAGKCLDKPLIVIRDGGVNVQTQ